jgi:hypothetical protein
VTTRIGYKGKTLKCCSGMDDTLTVEGDRIWEQVVLTTKRPWTLDCFVLTEEGLRDLIFDLMQAGNLTACRLVKVEETRLEVE